MRKLLSTVSLLMLYVYSPLNSHVFEWWIVFLPVVLCCVSCFQMH
jgi:hypothetical protein